MKPGIQTTEWWGTLFVHLITALTTIAVVFGKSLDVTGLNDLVPSLAIVSSGIAQGFYSHGRSLVKVADAAPSSVVVQHVPATTATTAVPSAVSSAMPGGNQ
jgi:hypothetical protein